MGAMNMAVILFSGSLRDFGSTLTHWLSQVLGEAPAIVHEDHQDFTVTLSIEAAAKVHGALCSSYKSLPGLIMSVFPSTPLFKGRELIVGDAVDRQRQLLDELAPMTARPDTRTDLVSHNADKPSS